jgi:hypothetical protein
LDIRHAEMLLNVVDHLASTRMNNPETNVRSRKSMSLQQLLECRLDHGASEVLNRTSQHDSQLSFAMLKSNLLDLLGIDESLKVDDLWIDVTGLLPGGKEESCGAISANCVPDNCFEGIIDVI